jgi:hypothetical protein
MDVLNRDCFDFAGNRQKAQKWFDEARGFSVDKSGMGVFNGGIVNPQREHLRVGYRYYRMVSAATDHSRKIGGVWWIEHEALVNIFQRFKATGANTRMAVSARSAPSSTVFREWLALTFEWNLIEEILYCDLAARIDAYTGAGRIAAGRHVMDTRGYGYAPHLSNLFTIKQLCIPELWVHQPKAFPNIRIVPYAQLESLL